MPTINKKDDTTEKQSRSHSNQTGIGAAVGGTIGKDRNSIITREDKIAMKSSEIIEVIVKPELKS